LPGQEKGLKHALPLFLCNFLFIQASFARRPFYPHLPSGADARQIRLLTIEHNTCARRISMSDGATQN
jgi:hypothetical protein